jgi:hypothetical protein
MSQSLRRLAATAGVLALSAAVAGASPAGAHGGSGPHGGPVSYGQATLAGFASLPAETFVPGSEPSGSLITAANGITPPFADQPVQGFSGIVDNRDGTYEVLSDNGYGSKANSADFLLRIHRIAPNLKTRAGGPATVDVLGGFHLTDPNGHVPFPLTRPDRVLTGADFDVESIVRAKDGSYWLGDEFGPYLLHVDRAGRLLAPPVPLPGVNAPESSPTPNLGGSRGFEGMAQSPDGRYLYPLLEGTVTGDTPGDLRFNEFDLRTGAYTGQRWTYRLDSPAYAIGDAIAVDANRFLVLERDGVQGAGALVKKVYLADRRDRDGDGAMDKTLVIDLLNLADPHHLGGPAETFRFPFANIETLSLEDGRTVAVLNDNNFPFSSGRIPGTVDNNEFITVRLTASLHPDPRVLR